MDKYIGFDIDMVKTAVCVIQHGKKEKYYTIPSDIRLKFNGSKEYLACGKFNDKEIILVFFYFLLKCNAKCYIML